MCFSYEDAPDPRCFQLCPTPSQELGCPQAAVHRKPAEGGRDPIELNSGLATDASLLPLFPAPTSAVRCPVPSVTWDDHPGAGPGRLAARPLRQEAG